ncbi:MAG: 30S ribosomal protein S20 [Planctomycetota bacterium]|jgi:small subunit ribosomal protein S20
MPHTKSAKKRTRQNVKRRDKNRADRSRVRTVVKKTRVLAESEPGAEGTEKAYRKAASELDRAARKGLIKKNQASRRKARLAKARNRSSGGRGRKA